MAGHRIYVVYEFGTKRQSCRIRCEECGRIVILPPKQAVATFGAITLIDALERRLRCCACGKKGAKVSGVYREWHG